MKILKIVKQTVADGTGLRNSIYVSGCAHACPGCHNPESWNFDAGTEMSVHEIVNEVLDPYADITITGGDPVYRYNEVIELCQELKKRNKNIWLFSGFTYEQIERLCPTLLLYIDVLVDGKYDETQRDLSRFCGSKNQRILYLRDGKIYKEE